MTDASLPPTYDLPEAVPDPTRRKRLPFAFLLPALVVIVAGIVVIQQQLARGPNIDINFSSADGLEVNKTKIRYKDVDIGEVRDIRVSDDRKEVIVTADIHRNAKAYLFAVIGAEYIARMLPRGTHDYARFIKPSELAQFVRSAQLDIVEIKGIVYRPLSKRFSLSDDSSINYLMACRRVA